jgi:hydrophobic/amphiphilic exporter-1 (mainly G- bacteria), HAE1 family
MQWLASVSVRRPVFATVMVLTVLVLGIVGYLSLGVDRFPKVEFPSVMVVTRLPGATPDQMETDVSDPIEEAINTISEIEELTSASSEGVSQVFVQFSLNKDVDVAAQEVRDKLSTIMADLPKDIDQPIVSKIDPDASPVMYIALRADKPVRDITEVADKIVRRQLQTAPGVGQVTVVGGSKRQVNVWIDPGKLRAYDLTAADVERAVAGQNVNTPGGRIEAGPSQLGLRIRGRVSNPAELGDLVLGDRDGRVLRIRDVARIEDGKEIAETAAIHDGRAAVMLSIRKQSGSNSVAVVDGVEERMKELTLPDGYALEVVRDNTATIRTSVHAVKEHLILGGLFAGLVVLMFLGNLRSTIIAGVAIPVSIVGTFALMWWKGFTLDTITLLALALAVGIVIDDAIVVLENIHRYVVEKKMAPMEAAIAATREIGLAVLATTLSLLAVFVPVAFMSGIVGRFLESFGLTMAFAIAVSMFVSFTLTPMLSSRWLVAARPIGNGPEGRHAQKPLLERMVDRLYTPVENAYVKLLAWVMRRRWVVVTASALTLVSVVPLMGMVGKGFLPKSDDAQFEINIRAPEGTSLDSTAILAERIARDVRTLPVVRTTLITIGDNNERAPNTASIYVKLSDPVDREQNQEAVMADIRRDIVAKQPKELRIDVSEVPMFAGGGRYVPIMYEISGPDLAKLEEYTAKLAAAVKSIPGAVDVDTNSAGGRPELSIAIDRERAADLGVSQADLSATLRLLVGGDQVSTYEEDGQTYDVHLRAEENFRVDADGLALVNVPSSKLGTVPLLDVVKVSKDNAPAKINRSNRRRQVTLLANLAEGYSQSAIIEGVQREIKALNMPAGYIASPIGQSKEMAKTAQAFLIAFGLSMLFMYLVLAAQFESWLHPITILIALPLTLPFALVSLILLGQSLDIYSCLGLLVLFGVVKKNAILQIDHTNQLRAEGMERLEAILKANRDRLRPILMTTVAFVAGMIPLAASNGVGAGFNRATAGVIVGGQVLSLLLTLLATPVVYSLFDDAGIWMKKRFGRFFKAESAEPELPRDTLPDVALSH